MKRTHSSTALLYPALLISTVMVLLLPGFYFHKDLQVFWKWAQVWRENWSYIYIACPDCNYPILGMFSSAGVMNMLNSLGFDRAVLLYRLLLSFVDGLNVFLIFWILRRLDVEKPAYTAGLIGISISSWAGGALWGQIDGVSQLFILLTLAWIIRKNTSTHTDKERYWLYLLVGTSLLACLLLTKQLTIFSALSLGLMLAADISFDRRTWKGFILYSALALIFFFAAISIWDRFLTLKPAYFSHFVYIWQEGIFQSGIIGGNGFNIWVLLGRDIWSSAHVPILASLPQATPYLIGEIFFLTIAVLTTLSLLLTLREHFQNGEKHLNREILLNLILHLAIINLAFNLFLTGTRDRYLFHFYPYILLAWAGLGNFSRLFTEKRFSVLFLCANLYGLFIFLYLSTLDFKLGNFPNFSMAILHFCLFVYIFAITLRYQNFFPRLAAFFAKGPKNLPTVR